MPNPILETRFQADGLPPEWYTDTPFPKAGRGRWDCAGWDGVCVPLPRAGWTRLRVEADLEVVAPGATAYAGLDSSLSLSLALAGRPWDPHQACDGSALLERRATPVPLADGKVRLVFEWTTARASASADGTPLLDTPHAHGTVRGGLLQLAFSRCAVTRLAVLGEPDTAAPAPALPPLARKAFPLEVTVDFNDDLMACAWSEKTFESLFAELKSWGARRVSWIDLGREADGYFDFAPLGIGTHARETLRNAGEPFAAAVRHAHAQGIELVGILKPFDMAIHGWSWPPFSEEARRDGRIAMTGGSFYWSTRMAERNRHLVMARKPSAHGPALNAVWTRLDLVKEDDQPCPLKPGDITLLVSDDNAAYRPYRGPLRVTETVENYPLARATPSGVVPLKETARRRVFRFDGLEVREPFLALRIVNGAGSFANRLCDLVHVFGEKGEERRLTFGLTPRRPDPLSPVAGGAAAPAEPVCGFEFDRYPGSPSSAWNSGGDPITAPLALDRGALSFLALARDKDPGTLACLSPSFPETRALWMGWVRAMLDAGADGIDIRPGHHHSHFAWGEYGFEAPVREEMLRRTGVDIWATDDFDRALWRRVRGEGWTQFLREASAEVRKRGKTLALHIDGYFDGAPGSGGAMNIACDWRDWLREGLADRVTGKSLWPETGLCREVLALAREKGVPVTYVPYCNNFFENRRGINHVGDSPEGCERPVERLIAWGRRAGFDGFGFYEEASALRARPDGTIGFRANAEPLRDVMRRQFGG